ncbi:ScbR family autoregulator-binding transcription factor [Leifsonia sp. SIMBA_070]|uniref:ScbR family autoregulator-binding transcription factor n=1 Tax=Leifsonia sp. SIMBA_070 TaxID=3085810 RepID=UPI00397A7E52
MPRQERAERTRVAILDAAAAEFDEHGYQGARLERIVQRTGATKGAVYFHFRSKLDIARALVDEKYANWPVIIAEVADSGLRGLAAAEELTQRVAAVFVADQRVRAAMKLSQSVFPPTLENSPYERWVVVISGLLQQEIDDRGLAGMDARTVATVVVQAFFGAYMIADELGTLEGLPKDVERLWAGLRPALGV